VAARDAARGEGLTSEYSRGQLLSAYSSSRHLTVELESYEAEVRNYAGEVSAWIRAAAPALSESDRAAAVAAELEQTRDARAAGNLTSDLLHQLRDDRGDAARQLRDRIHARLRVLAEREVAALAEVIEGPAVPAPAP
jgi:hypothetical protein